MLIEAASISMSCHFPRKDARTHGDDDEVRQKKSVKISYTHFDPALSKTILCIPT